MAIDTTNDYAAFQQIFNKIAESKGYDNSGDYLDKLNKTATYGSRISAYADLLMGFNKRQQGNALPNNMDLQGPVFFTRPNLNLSYDNVAADRRLMNLVNPVVDSLPRAIRVMLDPQSAIDDNITSPSLFDHKQAFIPLLSNCCISLTGWPDVSMNTYKTPEGIAKEVWMMNDSIADINGYYGLTATFKNVQGNPIPTLFNVWLRYMGNVYIGKMQPWPYSVWENEIDYMTRIYRFTLDWSGRYIQNWAICGAAMPEGVPFGKMFDHSRDHPYNLELDTVSVPFGCVYASYNDPIALLEFNRVGELFNPSLVNNPSAYRTMTYAESVSIGNYRGYPRINLKTNELTYWILQEEYEQLIKGTL